MNSKKYGIPPYSPLEGDDIRTIPDFYDNLYPAPENAKSCLIPPAPVKSKKRANSKNSEKKRGIKG